ncbi:MAG: thermonuclease family protein [Candidatus Omnitrophota bacterium]|nr:thermonuclease family protein [Candidatus Omnitrophota bacterium]MBU1929326.1 thermonuclease family protein [Candidatus Omnitrophota bacterium]MBU2035618.1 thermonuclease family protein [Candidatus Omnitrophota bacterium]MBU2221692.1 thermonuclease family protein [Candidatus Omnitrophota bacterium]MBU2258711.1 thermonuclease family protein [Candidatus Omnitrophota bacterium]
MRKIRIAGLAVFFLTLAVSLSFAASGKNYSFSDWKIFFPFGKKSDYNNILVTRAVDGDTLKLENGERVRLIGIDTPEMHDSSKLLRDSRRSHQDAEQIKKLGRRSYEFTRNLVQGRNVRLEFDVERKDKYGRLLAYVYLPDGTFVNAEIVKQGFASLMTISPNVKYADIFRQLYQEARENNRGLWK